MSNTFIINCLQVFYRSLSKSMKKCVHWDYIGTASRLAAGCLAEEPLKTSCDDLRVVVERRMTPLQIQRNKFSLNLLFRFQTHLFTIFPINSCKIPE